MQTTYAISTGCVKIPLVGVPKGTYLKYHPHLPQTEFHLIHSKQGLDAENQAKIERRTVSPLTKAALPE